MEYLIMLAQLNPKPPKQADSQADSAEVTCLLVEQSTIGILG